MASRVQLLVFVAALLGTFGNEAANLPMCIDNFAVHADKIIRTQDSRALGAKYLTEADVPGRADCLQLCCETPNCDVFVFEHKRGSCYLFHCGDPSDFRCKFTQHRNYTSGVLMPSSELEAQIKRTQHEEELAQLSSKKAEVPAVALSAVTEVTTRPVVTTPKTPVTSQNVPVGIQCSRYQFECRTTHECIAIYNACDGIAQCADASDEGPELDCPTLTGTVRPYQSQLHQKLPIPNEIHLTNDVKKSGPSHAPYSFDEKSEAVQAMEAQQELLAHVKHYGREGEAVPDGRGTYPGPIRKQEEQSRIFNHKGGVVPEGDSIPINAYPMDPREYPKQMPSNAYFSGNPYPQYNWPPRREDQRWVFPGPPPPPDYYYEESQMRRFPPSQADRPVDPVSAVSSPPPIQKLANNPAVKPVPAEKVVPKEDDVKPKETLSVKKVIVETTAKPLTTEPAPPSHDRLEMKEDDFVVVNVDGENERPRGAILSLGLGMCIAAIMLTLVGCRLRMVQRRLRRNGKPYAHDADFLVNGMYL